MISLRHRVFAILMLASTGYPADAHIQIVLRYDDYSNSSDLYFEQSLFDAARSVGAGVLVGVIPFPNRVHPIPGTAGALLPVDLSELKIAMLRRYADDGTAEVAAHGFSHHDTANGAHAAEFAGLPQANQELLAFEAKSALEVAFESPVRTFIPPYNAYDQQTLLALARSGYRLISAGSSGPQPRDTTLNFLPGGPYPHKLEDVINSAIAAGHTDAVVVVTMHPYDFVESHENMAEFRRGSPQIQVDQFKQSLHRLSLLEEVRFSSVRTLTEQAEDLSSERFVANMRLHASLVTRHRLLPEMLNSYPLQGLYYAKGQANRMYWFQLGATVAMHSALLLGTALLMNFMFKVGHERSRRFTQAGISAAAIGIVLLGTKAMLSGFYLISGIGLTLCLGTLIAAAYYSQSKSGKQAKSIDRT